MYYKHEKDNCLFRLLLLAFNFVFGWLECWNKNRDVAGWYVLYVWAPNHILPDLRSSLDLQNNIIREISVWGVFFSFGV